jgi:hypothetical protein
VCLCVYIDETMRGDGRNGQASQQSVGGHSVVSC